MNCGWRWGSTAALALTLVSAPAFGQGAETVAPGLDARLEALIRPIDRESDIRVGVSIHDVHGREIFAHREDEMFVLASNTKLLTTAAALMRLPSDYRWKTTARLQGDRLWLEGSGDPSLRKLGEEDWPSRFLDELAQALEAAGVRELSEIVLDDRRFDRVYRHPLWPDDQWQETYCAPISALSVEGGCVDVHADAPGRVRIEPSLDPTIEVDAKVGRSPRGRGISAYWNAARTGLVVRGQIRSATKVRLAVSDPLDQFTRWLAAGLRARGLRAPQPRLAGDKEEAPDPAPMFIWESVWTLGDAVTVANQDSDNYVTEMILKTLAAESGQLGSYANGVAEVRRVMAELKLDPNHFLPVDGSGLARNWDDPCNRSTPAAMCRLMSAMAAERAGRDYFNSLPVGGESSRLRQRFRAAVFQPRRVRAKTGWIRGASSLGGYVLAPDETILVFSIVINYRSDGTARTNNARFKRLQEDLLGAVLDTWPKPE